MERLSRKHEVTWADLKALAAKKYVGFHSYETSNASVVYIIEDGKPSFWTAIFKAGDNRYDDSETMQAARTEWAEHYAPFANGPTKPRDYDGRDKTQPVTLSSRQWHYWHSKGDSAEALRAGEAFQLSASGGEDILLTWRYRDPVWMAGGNLKYKNAALGDHVSFVVYAPETNITPNLDGTGNANLIPFIGLIVPAAGDGAYDVDLSDVHPVPAPNGDGFWNYDLPSDMKYGGTTTPGEAGESKYHLFAGRFDLTRFVAEELMLDEGSTSYSPQNINASLCLPEWRFECALHHGGGENTIDIVWRVLVSRYWTTL